MQLKSFVKKNFFFKFFLIFFFQLFSSIFAIAYAGIIHDHSSEGLEAETDHHHKIDHEHATSHQSFKVHHFHAVPVYVKHEDQHFLKNPVEVGGLKHKLKVCWTGFLISSIKLICCWFVSFAGSTSKDGTQPQPWADIGEPHGGEGL